MKNTNSSDEYMLEIRDIGDQANGHSDEGKDMIDKILDLTIESWSIKKQINVMSDDLNYVENLINKRVPCLKVTRRWERWLFFKKLQTNKNLYILW